MALISSFEPGPVALDTAPLIYYIEEDPKRLPAITALFEASSAGRFHLVTSTISLLEVLVLPLRREHPELAERYQDILVRSKQCTLIPVDSLVAQRAAMFRAKYHLRTPDAIQVATAWVTRATAFVTTDRSLAKIREIPVVALENIL